MGVSVGTGWILHSKDASHSYLARYFYMPKIYDWLMSHSLNDEDRPVNRNVKITKEDQNTVYSGWGKRPNLKTIR